MSLIRSSPGTRAATVAFLLALTAITPAPAQAPRTAPPSAASPPQVPRVRTVTPTAAATSRNYSIPGQTEPFESSVIFTRATGVVRERGFDIGDVVEAGAVMAVIDAPEIDKAVESAKAALDQAVARADIARQLATRGTALTESRILPREEADQRSANAIEADAAVRFAQSELERLQAVQQFATVRAPFGGVVAGRNFDRGDRVRGDAATSDGWLYRLVRLDQLRFVIAAPADLALRLSKESTAKILFRELPERTIEAKFFRSSAVIDRATGTMRVEFLIENPTGTVPAGLTGTATIALDTPTEMFVLPGNALMVDGGRPRVAVVQDGIVRMIPVTHGNNLGRNVEVASSELTVASAVIVNPNAMLREGDRVEIIEPEVADDPATSTPAGRSGAR